MYQSLGMWIMIDCIEQAKNDGYDLYYLGTAYGEKAKYKTNLPRMHLFQTQSYMQRFDPFLDARVKG